MGCTASTVPNLDLRLGSTFPLSAVYGKWMVHSRGVTHWRSPAQVEQRNVGSVSCAEKLTVCVIGSCLLQRQRSLVSWLGYGDEAVVQSKCPEIIG